MSEEFCVSSKLLPENSFPFENSQPLLHVHIKTLCIIYNTMQWHVCMGTVIRLCVMSELHCESSEWQLCTYKTLTSWHLNLFIEGLSTFQLQTYDLAPPPGKDITIIYPVTLATLLLKRDMSDILMCSLQVTLHIYMYRPSSASPITSWWVKWDNNNGSAVLWFCGLQEATNQRSIHRTPWSWSGMY